MTHPVSRISYFGNSRSHEIHCVSVSEVWTLVDLLTLMTHPEDDSSGVTYQLFWELLGSRDLLCECARGLDTS